MEKVLNKTKGDRVIWLIVIVLSLFSLLAVYSSTGTLAYKYQGGNTEYYLLKHFMLMAFGLFVMYFAHLVDYRYYSGLSVILLIASVPLLIFTLISGTNLNEANRWITLPLVNVTFQTSDLAKLALIMYLARSLSRKQDNIKEFRSFMTIMIPVILMCGLIAPANLSTASVLFATSLLIMFIGRVNIKYLMAMVGLGIVSLALVIVFALTFMDGGRVGTWKNRIENFTGGEDEVYQVQQAKIAIAKGGLFGQGPGNSTQRNFLPHPYSDFIYAIIVEEYGLIGGALIVFLYILLLFRAIKIVLKAPKAFGALLAVGLSFSLVIQAMINMAVTVNLLPVTGLTLPLVSMGGSSLWFISFAIGILLSISKNIEDLKEESGSVENQEQEMQKSKIQPA